MMQFSRRLQSIDVFRAVTMFLMIFVNDVDSVTNIPVWIKHAEENADALGFADTIFPAFLFIVGLSIPFALNKRMQSGESQITIAAHIIIRSFALIVMGTFHVNLENYSRTAALLPRAVFEILITVAFFLIWLDYKPGFNKKRQYLLQAIGVVILIVMAALFKGQSDNQIVWMRTYWWGILGLIGWGYLTCALFYLATKGRMYLQVAALIFFLVFNVTVHTQAEEFFHPVKKIIWFVGNGSMAAFIMSGIVITLIYLRSKQNNSRMVFAWLAAIAVVFILFGFITRPVAGISKDHDTPAWVGICTGISILVFSLLIFIVDIKGKTTWFAVIRPAGTSTLTCYLIPYLLYSFMYLFRYKYPEFFNQGIGGIIRSFAVAFIVIFIAGYLEKKHLNLKL